MLEDVDALVGSLWWYAVGCMNGVEIGIDRGAHLSLIMLGCARKVLIRQFRSVPPNDGRAATTRFHFPNRALSSQQD